MSRVRKALGNIFMMGIQIKLLSSLCTSWAIYLREARGLPQPYKITSGILANETKCDGYIYQITSYATDKRNKRGFMAGR